MKNVTSLPENKEREGKKIHKKTFIDKYMNFKGERGSSMIKSAKWAFYTIGLCKYKVVCKGGGGEKGGDLRCEQLFTNLS